MVIQSRFMCNAGRFMLVILGAGLLAACSSNGSQQGQTYAPNSQLTHRVYALNASPVQASDEEKVSVITQQVAPERWNDEYSGHTFKVDNGVLVAVTHRLNHYNIRRYLTDGSVPAPEPVYAEPVMEDAADDTGNSPEEGDAEVSEAVEATS